MGKGWKKDFEKNEQMKIVTVNIPNIYLHYIQKLIEKGICPSRSEYIRWSIGNQINRDLEKLEKMERMAKDIEGMRQTLKEEALMDYDNVKYVRIPGRVNGEEFVKIVKRLDY